jgi:hypothetical protein
MLYCDWKQFAQQPLVLQCEVSVADDHIEIATLDCPNQNFEGIAHMPMKRHFPAASVCAAPCRLVVDFFEVRRELDVVDDQDIDESVRGV